MIKTMNGIIWIGYFATAVTVLAFLPQVIKAWKSKQTKDISLGSYLLLLTAALSWLCYGILIIDIPIIVTNAGLFCLQAIVVFLKLKHG